MRRFPKEPLVCLAWVQASGNPILATLTIAKLSRGYYLCNAHFEVSDGANERRLRVGSVPKIFSHNSPVSDASLLAFAKVNNMSERSVLLAPVPSRPHADLPFPAAASSRASSAKEHACEGT